MGITKPFTGRWCGFPHRKRKVFQFPDLAGFSQCCFRSMPRFSSPCLVLYIVLPIAREEGGRSGGAGPSLGWRSAASKEDGFFSAGCEAATPPMPSRYSASIWVGLSTILLLVQFSYSYCHRAITSAESGALWGQRPE